MTAVSLVDPAFDLEVYRRAMLLDLGSGPNDALHPCRASQHLVEKNLRATAQPSANDCATRRAPVKAVL